MSRPDELSSPGLALPRMFQRFFQAEATGGVLLLGCAVVALVWANSPLSPSYFHFWEIPLAVGLGEWILSMSIHHWINDGLMAVFFFVVGLEIKRELMVGELSSARKAALPVAAAVGGMIAPALVYLMLNAGTEASSGWGIAMATDIAFSLGVLALLGSRVPVALKIFLAALAIADDLGAVLVIAVFYTASISWTALGIGAVLFGLLIVMNLAGVARPSVYAVVGLGLWLAFLSSGVHATIAGVLLATTIPANRRIDAAAFVDRTRGMLDRFSSPSYTGNLTEEQRDALHAIEEASEHVQTPLSRLEHGLHPWVAFVIMPVFALANAGVAFRGDIASLMGHPVALGVLLGLVLGKQLGVTAFAWLAVRLGFAELPEGVTWRDIYGVAWLCGIGFTMSIFIAGLAFAEPSLLDYAKVGIFAASFLSGLGGWLILSRRRSVGS